MLSLGQTMTSSPYVSRQYGIRRRGCKLTFGFEDEAGCFLQPKVKDQVPSSFFFFPLSVVPAR